MVSSAAIPGTNYNMKYLLYRATLQTDPVVAHSPSFNKSLFSLRN